VLALVSAAHHLATAGFAVALPSEDVALPGAHQPEANHPELNDETVRQQVLWRSDCAAWLNEFGPEPEFGFGTLEANLSKGVEEIIPVVAFGVAWPNVDFVVAGSHGGGTVKVTQRPGG